MPRSPRDRYSLALFLLPHAGLSMEVYERARRLLLAELLPLGGPSAVAIATEISPLAVRDVILDLLDESAHGAGEEVAA